MLLQEGRQKPRWPDETDWSDVVVEADVLHEGRATPASWSPMTWMKTSEKAVSFPK